MLMRCLEAGFFCFRSASNRRCEIGTSDYDAGGTNILGKKNTSSRDSSVRSSHSRRPSWVNEILSDNQRKEHHSRSSKSVMDSIIGDFRTESDFRLIFLDVDGTINHLDGDDTTVAGTICGDCVDILRQILDQTNSKIVLSSSWRLKRYQRKTLFRYLREVDVAQGMIVGETRDLSDEKKNRTDEIKDWLANPYFYHNHENLLPSLIRSWVSLDDLDLAEMEQDEELKNNYIKLDPKLGLCRTKNIVTRVVEQMTAFNLSYGWYEESSRLPTFSISSTSWSGRSSIRVLPKSHDTHNSRILRSLRGNRCETGSTTVMPIMHARVKTLDVNLADMSYSLYYDDDGDFERHHKVQGQNLLGAAWQRLPAPERHCDGCNVASRYKCKRRNIPRSQSQPLLIFPPPLREEQDIFQDYEDLESSEPGFDQQTDYENSQKMASSYQPTHCHLTTPKSKDILTPSISSEFDGVYDLASTTAVSPDIERAPLPPDASSRIVCTTSSGHDHSSISNGTAKIELADRKKNRKANSACMIRYPAPQTSLPKTSQLLTFRL
jgi:hypothetical protein